MPAKEARQQRDKAANQEALQALAAREGQQRQLAGIRLELERLRLLLERVSKRERLKRDSELPFYNAGGSALLFTCTFDCLASGSQACARHAVLNALPDV